MGGENIKTERINKQTKEHQNKQTNKNDMHVREQNMNIKRITNNTTIAQAKTTNDQKQTIKTKKQEDKLK